MMGVVFLITSFKSPDLPPVKTYNLFYVDNSYSKNYENFSQDIFEVLERNVDSLKNDKFAVIGFFLSDGPKTDFASNYNGAKDIINRLSNGSTSAPNSFYDRSYIVDLLLTTDLSNIKGVNFNFFLTEAGLLNDYLVGSNAGIFINSLPKEIQFLLGCNEENITVNIYYPASSKKVTSKILESFTKFSDVHSDFASKIKFKFQPI